MLRLVLLFLCAVLLRRGSSDVTRGCTNVIACSGKRALAYECMASPGLQQLQSTASALMPLANLLSPHPCGVPACVSTWTYRVA